MLAEVEYGVEMNNRACEGKRVYGSGGMKQCHQLRHEEGCKVLDSYSRPLKFETGRKDCVTSAKRPFEADKEEIHPNAVGNGKQTRDFFHASFNY